MSTHLPWPDGFHFYGVVTTGVYCLPSCPSIAPKPANIRYFMTSDEAEASGLRACKRCRPKDLEAAA